jgi:hypothetical protein
MSYTKEYDAVQGSWTLVIDQQTSGAIQLKDDDDGPVLVHIGASAPASDSEDAFVLVREDNHITGMQFNALEATDKVYVRSRHDESNTVVATAPGTAPS